MKLDYNPERRGSLSLFPLGNHPKSTVQYLKRTGWTVKANRGHYKCTSPRGFKLFMGSTPSDYRAVRNVAARIRRVMAMEGSTV